MRLGPHTEKLHNPDDQHQAAKDNGWGAIQTFLGNPRSASVPKSMLFAQEARTTWIIHSAYVVHAAPPPERYDYIRRYIQDLAREGVQRKATVIVIHTGGTKTRTVPEVAADMKAFLDTVDPILDHTNGQIKLAVENVAAAYAWNQDLNNLPNLVKQYRHIGWCLDTAHAWAAGATQANVIEAINNLTPLVAHINYPGSKRGCGLDRHGWRYNADEYDAELAILPDERKTWDDTIRTLNTKDVPLIMEGGSKDGSYEAEYQAIKNLIDNP